MIGCETSREFIIVKMNEGISQKENTLLERHILECTKCKKFERFVISFLAEIELYNQYKFILSIPEDQLSQVETSIETKLKKALQKNT